MAASFFLLLAVLVLLAEQLWHGRLSRTRSWWLMLCGLILAVAAIASLVRSDVIYPKMIALMLMPVGLLWLLLIGIAIAAWRARRTALALALSAAVLADTVAGNVLVGTWMIARLEQGVPACDLATVARFDAVCVLGGGTQIDAEGHFELGDCGDRLLVAARLYMSGKTPYLVASGTDIAGIEGDRNNLADITASLWRGIGIPASAIITIPPGPVNTAQELAAYKTLIAARGWQRVGLVSSAWHLPRALRLCEPLGLSLVPIPCDHRNRLPAVSWYWLIPQERGYQLLHHACWELLGGWLGR
jgi:uncharacterized SAM-binding protein YcdF (DUF218 family)